MPTIHLRNDTIILYKRPESPNWQAEFRYSDGSVRKISTRTANEHEASAFAINAYSGQHALAKAPKPKVTFGVFCKKYSEALAAKPIQKAIYPTYRMFLEKWIEPFFRDHTSIDEDDLDKFYAHHRQTLGRVPAKNTINAMNVVLRSIFRLARKEEFPITVQKLTTKDLGRDTIRRSAMKIVDYRTLYRASRKWKKEKTHRGISRYKRQVLHEMILIIANTGIRPGSELKSIRWRDVTITPKAIDIHIPKGKKGPRFAMARLVCKRYFERLHDLTGHHDLIFSMPDGSPFEGEGHMFMDLLAYAGLSGYSLYSLRHLYATQRVLKRVPYAILSKQMGTSIGMLAKHYDQSELEAFAEFFTD